MDNSLSSHPRSLNPYQSVRSDDVELRQQRRFPSLNNRGTVRRKSVANASSEPEHETTLGIWDEDTTAAGGGATQRSGQAAVWSPGFWKRLPIPAVLSLIGVLLCTAASIVVLVVSNGADIQRWSTHTPSVYLAIFSVIANTLLGFALADGLVISFWLLLLESCTVAELNRNWECGNSIWPALRHGFRRGGRVTAVARIIALIALFRGPLYQRASTIDANHTVVDARGTTELHIAQRLPEGYTGINVVSRVYSTRETALLTPAFVQIMNDFSSHSNMTLNQDVCSGICTTTVNGFGFKSRCSVAEIFDDYESRTPGSRNLFNTSIELLKVADNPADTLNLTFFAGLKITAIFNQGRIESVNNGNTSRIFLTSHVCNLTAGIVEYKISLARSVVTLSSRNEDTFSEEVDLVSPGSNYGNTTIGGFQYAGDYTFKASAVQEFAGAVSPTYLTGAIANQMLNSTRSPSNYYIFNDPMDLMLDGLREIAFRASLKAGRENVTMNGVRQNVAYISYGTYSVYRTDYPYLILAVLISLAGVISVIATFYGWWRLGRTPSMNPLEIGKAFKAPMLEDAGSNVSFNAFPGHLKNSRVRYGSLPSETASRVGSMATSQANHLAIGGAEEVFPPKDQSIYDT